MTFPGGFSGRKSGWEGLIWKFDEERLINNSCLPSSVRKKSLFYCTLGSEIAVRSHPGVWAEEGDNSFTVVFVMISP